MFTMQHFWISSAETQNINIFNIQIFIYFIKNKLSSTLVNIDNYFIGPSNVTLFKFFLNLDVMMILPILTVNMTLTKK